MATTRQPVAGLRELGAAFKELSAEVKQRAARRATNAGAQVVKGAVAQKALQQPTLADKPFKHDGVTYTPGHIARNVIVKRIPEPELTSEHIVTVRSNKKNGYAGRIASLNEHGTVKMAPQPFMGPGFDASKGEALNATVGELSRAIKAAAKKAKKARQAK